MGVSVYVVGGFVRDLLLRIDNLDIDIVVEGDGIGFAKTLAGELGGRVKSHAKFGTSVIILEDGFRIDVATARLEFYKHPGALPTVEKSSIKADLFRRDFTINALAIKLNGRDPFCLIDFFNGERDLKDGVLRVLHNLSFIEDPCRMFRAIRFEQRFRFKLGKQTQAFMKNAIDKKLVAQLSPTRLLNELIQILKEENPIQCVRRMIDVSLFQFVSPRVLENKESVDAMERIEEVLTWAKMVPLPQQPEVWFVYFIGLFCPLDKKEFAGAVDRLRLPQRLHSRLQADCAGCREAARRLALGKSPQPEEVYGIFSGLSPEAVIYLLAVSASDRVNKLATLYFTQYHSQADFSLNGKDLIELGVEPGPIFQTVFQSLREARLKGKVKSRKDEVALVEKEFLVR